jgi:alkylated DNA nucleotide flippase Atl1
MLDTLTVSERVALVVLELATGKRLTTRQVAELCGISRQGAWLLLCRISRVVPLGYGDGVWYFSPSTKR